MKSVTVISGTGPIILGQPHSGTFVPDDVWANLNDTGRQMLDTDWYVPTLYDGLLDGVTVVRANFSRYVIDANRDPQGTSLYPGQNTTELVPTTTFDGETIWRKPLSDADKATRLYAFHRAYHQALQSEIERVKTAHGFVVLYDCHSIRSQIPYLFDDRLLDLNIGDNGGTSCSPVITEAIERACARQAEYSHVVNGRFKGGWTTRYYGRPDEGVHAVQMELAQRQYLQSEEPPFAYDENKAANLRRALSDILRDIQTSIQTSLVTEA